MSSLERSGRPTVVSNSPSELPGLTRHVLVECVAPAPVAQMVRSLHQFRAHARLRGIALALASTLASGLATSGVEARVMVATHTGAVYSGIDYVGAFGRRGPTFQVSPSPGSFGMTRARRS